MTKFQTILILLISYATCSVASGVVPLFSKTISNFNLSWGFFPYFLFLFLGQFFVYKSNSKILSGKFYVLIISLFTASLLLINYFIQYEPNNPNIGFYLIMIRAFEGLLIGISLPLVFFHVLNSPFSWGEDKKLLMLNIYSMLGHILGFVIFDHWKFESISFITAHIFLNFLLITLLFISIIFQKNKYNQLDQLLEGKSQATKTHLSTLRYWFETYYLLTLVKLYYGYFISYILFSKTLQPYSLTHLIIIIVVLHISGQIIASYLSRYFSLKSLCFYTMIGFSYITFKYGQSPKFTIFISMAFLHSLINFFGQKKMAYTKNSSKAFALNNGISDVGLIFGALLPIYSEELGMTIISTVAIIPFVIHLFSHYQYSRCESFYPLIDPTTLLKRELKVMYASENKSTLNTNLTWDYTKKYISENEENKDRNLKIIFAGDNVFNSSQFHFSDETKHWILEHPIRVLNLEAPFILGEDSRSNFSKKITMSSDIHSFHSFNTFNDQPLFNVINVINNHCLDLGIYAFYNTETFLKSQGIHVINSNSSSYKISINNKQYSLGFLARSFGVNNIFQKSKIKDAFISPDTLQYSYFQKLKLKNELNKLSSLNDLAIFSYHWGYESEFVPSSNLIELSDFLKSEGVNILYGHHSHLAQPFQISADQKFCCLYSCGNLNLELGYENIAYKKIALYSIEYDLSNKKVISAKTNFFSKNNNTKLNTNGIRYFSQN